MKTMLMIAVAGALLAAVPSSADAQRGQYITRTTTSGQTKVLPLPTNKAQCLANRRALGYNIKKQGEGRCKSLFPNG